MQADFLIILCTCPNKDSATAVANTLVSKRLAACVNILPGLTSVYHWQGNIESSEECLLIIKSTQKVYPEIESAIRQTHPYELPEIVAVPIEKGLEDYLAWIEQNVLPHNNT